MTRKPLKFDIERDPPASLEKPSPPPQAQPHVESGKKQVGARISADLYRQLKARAALQGKTVQDLLEQAVEKFLS